MKKRNDGSNLEVETRNLLSLENYVNNSNGERKRERERERSHLLSVATMYKAHFYYIGYDRNMSFI